MNTGILMGKAMGKGLDALLRSSKYDPRRVDTLKTYKEAVILALKDGIVTDDEATILANLAKNLGLTDEERDIVTQEAKAECADNRPEPKQTPLPPPQDTSELEKEIKALRIENEALVKEMGHIKVLDDFLVKENASLTDKIKALKEELKAAQNKK